MAEVCDWSAEGAGRGEEMRKSQFILVKYMYIPSIYKI